MCDKFICVICKKEKQPRTGIYLFENDKKLKYSEICFKCYWKSATEIKQGQEKND